MPDSCCVFPKVQLHRCELHIESRKSSLENGWYNIEFEDLKNDLGDSS